MQLLPVAREEPEIKRPPYLFRHELRVIISRQLAFRHHESRVRFSQALIRTAELLSQRRLRFTL